MVTKIILGGLLVSGCTFPFLVASAVSNVSHCKANYIDERYMNDRLTSYTVPRKLHKSPMGVAIGDGVDGNKVDKAFVGVSQCLDVEFHPCAVHAVMIAPDWKVVEDNHQAFPCKHPNDGPKFCTGVNQYPATIIITPDYHALTWEVERMLLKDDPSNDNGKNCWQQVKL